MGPDTVPTKKSEMVRLMIRYVVRLHCEYGKTIYNRYHGQFNDKDSEPRGPQHRGRRTTFCLIAHSLVSTPLRVL